MEVSGIIEFLYPSEFDKVTQTKLRRVILKNLFSFKTSMEAFNKILIIFPDDDNLLKLYVNDQVTFRGKFETRSHPELSILTLTQILDDTPHFIRLNGQVHVINFRFSQIIQYN